MVDESDGIGEAFDGQIRVALAAAMQMAQYVARLREELARNSQTRTQQQDRELQVRLDAERAAARASLVPVDQPGWWDRASVAEIADAYETTEAWRPIDRDVASVGDRMKDELRSRYSVEVEDLTADPAAVRDAIARAEQGRAEVAHAREKSRQEFAEAATLLTAADQLDKLGREIDRERQEEPPSEPIVGSQREDVIARADAVRYDSTLTYDSAERRAGFSADMENENVDADLRTVRLAADRENATHPRDAVATKPRSQGKAGTDRRSREWLVSVEVSSDSARLFVQISHRNTPQPSCP